MSEKFDDHPNDFLRERKTCHSPRRSRTRRSSLKKKHSRVNSKSSEGRGSVSGSREKSRRFRRAKNCTCSCDKSGITSLEPILNKTRAEHLTEEESTVCQSGTSRSTRLERKRQRKGAKKKKRTKKKKKNQKNRSVSKNKKLTGPTACSRLIEFIFKRCSCLKSIDTSSSACPCTDTCCCCCCSRYKYRFCTPDCNSKSIQCDDCERHINVGTSRRGSVDVCDSVNKVASQLANERTEKLRKCVMREKSESACEKRINDFRWIARRGESYEKLSARPRCRNRKNKSDSGIRESVMKSFISLKGSKKRPISANSLIDERNISKDRVVAKSPDGSSSPCDEAKFIPPSGKHLEFQEIKGNCDKTYSCGNDDCGKTTKALLIMFDIVFWPYTCLPGFRYRRNKNKKK